MTEFIFPEVVDSSMRAAFVSCPRQFFYQYGCGLSSKRASIHLHFGACFASGLETFRRDYYSPEAKNLSPVERHQQALYLGLLTILREWGEYPPADEPPKTLYHCLAALQYYFEVHPPFTDIIQPYITLEGKPAVEYSFSFPIEVNHPITGNPLLYSGRFDMLGVYNNQLMVVDEKTTKQLGMHWSSSWDMRAQFKGYAYAAHMHNHQVMGAMVRGIALRATGLDHGEAIVSISKWDLDRWYIQINRDFQRMVQCFEEDYWDLNLDSSCTSYGGCGFTPLCKVPDPSRWIDAEYAVRRWNPLLKDPLAESRKPLPDQTFAFLEDFT